MLAHRRVPCEEPKGWASSGGPYKIKEEPSGWHASYYELRGRKYVRLSKTRPGQKRENYYAVKWYRREES